MKHKKRQNQNYIDIHSR